MRILATATAGLRRFLDLLLIALILVVLLGVLLGKFVPLTGRQTMIVGGGSMEPTIGLGAAVVIRPVPAEALLPGDIVSLRAGEGQAIFTHRIVEVVDRPDGRWIRTKGDANALPDPTLIAASAVIGRSELSIPYAGYLLALLSSPTGVLFLVGLAATLLAAAWLLESLELDRAENQRVTFLPGTDRTRGEPIAARALQTQTMMLEGSFGGGGVRLNGAEQLAVVRAAREQRNPIPGSFRRAHRRTR
jgi:signal peptidase I